MRTHGVGVGCGQVAASIQAQNEISAVAFRHGSSSVVGQYGKIVSHCRVARQSENH